MIIDLLKKILKYKKIFLTFFYTLEAKTICKSYKGKIRVNYKSKFTKNTTLGYNVHFNGIKIKGNGNILIGDNFHSGEGCLILSDIHDYNSGAKLPYGSNYILKDIVIENNVWIGDRVIILGGVTLGEGSIIQAGSVVVKDIPKYAIAGGHPAKVFSQRNIEHYEELKLNVRAFH